ncbi:hypothetical protein ACFYO1_02885 [Nocardia sp. NPDC006044]|uniref:hypothetical protein n=1 Tax=Nocardia sp. NPDC006044 TaxID=3364306 RepID=UPI0036B1E18A
MTHSLPGLQELPSWKLRLLEKIQNTAADRAKALEHAFPVHEPGDGAGDLKIQNWRTHLLVLASDLHELQLRARAMGVPHSAVEAVREAGQWGLRWGDSVHSPAVMRYGEPPELAFLVDRIVKDVWDLEHMAVIRVEHELRNHNRRFPHDPEAAAQFDRNMAALWQRASASAAVVLLSGVEAEEIWGRDEHGWRDLAEVTVRTYSDADLYERWRTLAWRGREHTLGRTTDNLGLSAGTDLPGHHPPLPEALIERAREALSTESDGQGAGDQVEVALASTGEASWINEPDGHNDPPPRDPGPPVELEL